MLYAPNDLNRIVIMYVVIANIIHVVTKLSLY